MKLTQADLDNKVALEKYNNIAPTYLSDDFTRASELIVHGDPIDPRFALTHQLDALGLSADYVPDVIGLTMKSALPIADVIRGVYGAAGIDCPQIIGIAANRTLGNMYYDLGETHLEMLASEEIERIKPLVDRRFVTIIDEFACYGKTIKLADDIVQRAGARATRLVFGRWYQDIGHTTRVVTEPYITSDFAGRLFAVGKLVWQQYLAQTDRTKEAGGIIA